MSQRSLTAVAALVCALALAACGSSSTSTSSTSGASGNSAASMSSAAASAGSSSQTVTDASSGAATGPTIGYEGVPLERGPYLAPPSTTSPRGVTVDGIKCAPIEQLYYHIHAHLAVFDNGRLYALPAGIGIPGSTDYQTQYGPVAIGAHCFYWLHTHTADGVIHIESPKPAIYDLGDFFDIWHQPLSGDQVASLHGKITAFVNGHAWTRSLRAIPLLPHEDIQFDIGDPIPPIVKIDWSKTQL